MGILTSYLGNQLSSKPANTSDFLADYFGKQLGASANNPQANVTPQSTTINYNSDGSADVTHKQTIGKDSNLAASQTQQPQHILLLRILQQLQQTQTYIS